MEYMVGHTHPYPPALEPDDDPTPVAPCMCESCARVAEVVAVARSYGTFGRLTTMHSCLSDSPFPYMAAVSDKAGRLLATAKGATEHEALLEVLEALREKGLLP